MVKNANRKGAIVFPRGSTAISTIATSRHSATTGVIAESAAPPPNLRFAGGMIRGIHVLRVFPRNPRMTPISQILAGLPIPELRYLRVFAYQSGAAPRSPVARALPRAQSLLA
jgi:hypothetical protein